MSLDKVYGNAGVCKMEEKFSLSKIAESDGVVEYVGNYHLEPFREDARGTYGGEFVAQSLAAAWESVPCREFDIHSLHSYFLKAGLIDSVMRFEVSVTSQGQNYCNRLVKCYQLHTNSLCYVLMASFTRNNNIKKRKEIFDALEEDTKRHARTKVPFEFLRKPHYTFLKYKDAVDKLLHLEHTNGNITHIILKETWKGDDAELAIDPASREFGLFCKVNDNVAQAKDPHRAHMVDFAFLSDSFYLSTIQRAVFSTLDYSKDFFKVSLDHTVYYHDTDFDPTQWMFMDYKFMRLSNDRALVICQFFTMDQRLVATVLQEAMVLFPFSLVETNPYGTYKL